MRSASARLPEVQGKSNTIASNRTPPGALDEGRKSGYGTVTTVTTVTNPPRAGILAVAVCVTGRPQTVMTVTNRGPTVISRFASGRHL